MASNAPAADDTGSVSAATTATTLEKLSLLSEATGISYEHAGISSGVMAADAMPANGFMPPFLRSETGGADSRSLSITPGLDMPLSFDLISFGVSPSETLEGRKADAAELVKTRLTDSVAGVKDGTYYRLQDDGGYRFLRRKGVSSSGPQRGWKIHVSLDYAPDNLEAAKNLLIHVCAEHNIPIAKIARGIGGGYQLGKGAVIYCCSARDEVVWSKFLNELVSALQAGRVRPGAVPCYRLQSVLTDIAEGAIPDSRGFLYVAKDTCRSLEAIDREGRWEHFQRDIMAGGIATPFASRALGGACGITQALTMNSEMQATV